MSEFVRPDIYKALQSTAKHIGPHGVYCLYDNYAYGFPELVRHPLALALYLQQEFGTHYFDHASLHHDDGKPALSPDRALTLRYCHPENARGITPSTQGKDLRTEEERIMMHFHPYLSFRAASYHLEQTNLTKTEALWQAYLDLTHHERRSQHKSPYSRTDLDRIYNNHLSVPDSYVAMSEPRRERGGSPLPRETRINILTYLYGHDNPARLRKELTRVALKVDPLLEKLFHLEAGEIIEYMFWCVGIPPEMQPAHGQIFWLDKLAKHVWNDDKTKRRFEQFYNYSVANPPYDLSRNKTIYIQ